MMRVPNGFVARSQLGLLFLQHLLHPPFRSSIRLIRFRATSSCFLQKSQFVRYAATSLSYSRMVSLSSLSPLPVILPSLASTIAV